MSGNDLLISDDASPKETERTMLDRLNMRYGAFNGNGIRYARAEHVKVSAGFDSRRICDYMALDLWPGGFGEDAGPKLHGHEVKVSRADWLVELKDPSKAAAFSRYCDYWWLVVSDRSIVKPGELPDGWGLMVASGISLRAATNATLNADVEPLPRNVQATFARSVTKTAIRLTHQGDRATDFLTRRMNLPAYTT